MADLDLAALKRSLDELEAQCVGLRAALKVALEERDAALGRIPRLEQDRGMLQRAHDAWQKAAAEWEAQARTYIASNAHWRRRAERLEAAAREWAEAWDDTHGLTFTGAGPFPQIERRDRAEHALRAALAAAQSDTEAASR